MSLVYLRLLSSRPFADRPRNQPKLRTSPSPQKILNRLDDSTRGQLGSTVNFQSSVINLGVTIDGPITMRDHVLRICRTSFYQLRQLRVIRGSLSTETCTALIHAFISSRLDYCNSLFAGLSDERINKLQSVLSSAARLVLRKRKFDHITDDLRDQLHWLPIRQGIQYKRGLLVYKCLRGDAPSYLADMISRVVKGSQRLRSAAHGNLAVPPTRTVRMGPRSFAIIAQHYGTRCQ